MKRLTTYFHYLLLTVSVLVLFGPLVKTFYQQDEWLALGNMLVYGRDYFFLTFSGIDRLLLGEGRILSRVIAYIVIGGSPFSLIPLTVFAIVFHIINTLLVYCLIGKFLRKPWCALAGSMFYSVNAVSHQAVTWPAAVVGTLPATTLILLSVLAYFKAIGGYDFSRKPLSVYWIGITVLLVYISLLFKEVGLFLFALFPFTIFLFRKDLLSGKLKFLAALPFVILASYKVLSLRARTTESNLYITGLAENFFLTIAIRAALYPLTSLSLIFVPGAYFLEFAREVLRDNYPYFASSANNILIAQTVILDLLAVVLTGILLGVIFLFLRGEKQTGFKAVVFWLSFVFFSFSPYIVLAKDFSYLESRYYYVPVVGGAFLLGWFLLRIREIVPKAIFIVAVIPLYILYILVHANAVNMAIREQVELATMRRSFISQLKSLVPSLDSKKNVFYITGDQDYWADDNKVPFQQGTGYTLLVLYVDSPNVPKDLLKEEYLYKIGGQGYREIGERGFGYFSDKGKLNEAVEFYNLPRSSIIGLRWNSNERELAREND